MRGGICILGLVALTTISLAAQPQNPTSENSKNAPVGIWHSPPPPGKKIPEPPSCPAKFDDAPDTVPPGTRFSDGLTPPKPTLSPEAEFSDKARKEFKKKHLKYFDGVSILSLVVGVDGIPRDMCLIKPASYGLDAQAAKAAWQYRFEPATKEGKPVPARTAIEVDFRLY